MFKLVLSRNMLPGGLVRNLRLILLDAGGIVFALCLALILYFQGRVTFDQWSVPLVILGAALVGKLPVFAALGMYRVKLLDIHIEDMTRIFLAVSMGSIVFAGLITPYWADGRVALDVVAIDYFVTLVFVGGLRASKRVYSQMAKTYHGVSLRRVLVAGAGSAGELTLQAILQERGGNRLPVGIVDDDPEKQGMTVHGVPVIGKRSDIPRLVRSQGARELLIAMPSAPPAVLRETVDLGRKAGLKTIKIVPALHRMVNGEVAASDLRDLQVDDLLGREPVQIDTQEIMEYLRGKTVLVTGAAGSIGSELCRQIAPFGPELLLVLDHEETGLFHLRQDLSAHFPDLNLFVVVGDIQDRDRVRNMFATFRPAVVFHVAAYKHVSMMEENPEEAVMNNVIGTNVVAESACSQGTERFVFISTDKAVNPTCVMGATKRLAEMTIQSLNGSGPCQFMAVRFGNVLGSRGSVVPIFREQILRGGPVTVTHPEMRRYFMTPSEAALLVLQAGAIGSGGKVFVLDMGSPVSILELAREMIHLAGLEPDKDIPIVFTKPYPGEKLFEDILTAEEGTVATKHQRIYVAKTSDGWEGDRLQDELRQLNDVARRGDRSQIIKALCALVPNYSPPNGTCGPAMVGRSGGVAIALQNQALL